MATPNGPDRAKNNKAADKENSTDTQNLQMSKGRSRNRDKPKLINEDHNPEVVEESNLSQMADHVSEQKKEAAPGVPHSKVQPTTEQLMIAKIIDRHSDDPDQQKKIGQVLISIYFVRVNSGLSTTSCPTLIRSSS